MTKSRDVITEIKIDHKVISDLWERFQTTAVESEKQKIANSIIREIAVHSTCEEIVLYPTFEKHLKDGTQLANHSREEHAQVKKDLYELDKMKASDAGYSSLIGKVMKELLQHIKEEEDTILPKFQSAINLDELSSLGKSFANTRLTAPTHPHPDAPDKPPAETIAGTAALPVDKARDAMREFADTIREQLEKAF